MGTVTKTARPLDDNIEDFEARIRVNPERDPQAKPQAKRRGLASRLEIRMNGSVVYDDEPDTRVDKLSLIHI